MSKDQNLKKASDVDMVDIRSTLNKLIFHWPLYLLMIIISLLGAYIYLRYTRPVYSSTAEIYIKDDKNKGGAQSALEQLDMFNSNKIVENEMEVIKSPLILEDVIRDNKFNIKYYIKGKVLNQEIYDNRPLLLNILTDSSKVGDYVLKVEILDNNKLRITFPTDRKKKDVYQTLYTQFDRPFQIHKDRFSISYLSAFNVNHDKDFEIKVDSILPLVYEIGRASCRERV